MNQDELRARIDLCLESDRLEEASELIEQLAQVDADEFLRRLASAPPDDEPVSAGQRAALDRARDVIRGDSPKRARSLG